MGICWKGVISKYSSPGGGQDETRVQQTQQQRGLSARQRSQLPSRKRATRFTLFEQVKASSSLSAEK